LLKELGKLPDLERMISRVHAGTCRLSDFLGVLEGFESMQQIITKYFPGEAMQDGNEENGAPTSFKSDRLKRITSIGDLFPDMIEDLEDFSRRFDRERAREENCIVPFPGFEKDYDTTMEKVAVHEGELQEILEDVKKMYKNNKIIYKHIGKSTYQLEIPLSCIDDKPAPKDWLLMSTTKVRISKLYPEC
jgi:DNA mismatch repair protein MSH6